MEVLNARPGAGRTEGTGIQFLEERHEPRRIGALAASALLHALVLVALSLTPRSVLEPPVYFPQGRSVTPLVAPPQTLTQTAPNRGKVGQEVALENLLPRRPMRIPPGAAAALRAPAPQPAPPPPYVPEPPKIYTPSTAALRAPPSGALEAPPAPQIQTEERPRLAFETPGSSPSSEPRVSGGLAPPRRLAPPNSSVSEAVRGAAQSGGAIAVGDLDAQSPLGMGRGVDIPQAPGRTATALELQSDPMGVDFKPYLIRILAAVKRNWLAVIPESARLGRVGRVQIQFAIARDGSVPKLVIAMPSGTDALDRAAVAGISASTPFPPLPKDFQGSQVRLQFTFTYNLK